MRAIRINAPAELAVQRLDLTDTRGNQPGYHLLPGDCARDCGEMMTNTTWCAGQIIDGHRTIIVAERPATLRQLAAITAAEREGFVSRGTAEGVKQMIIKEAVNV